MTQTTPYTPSAIEPKWQKIWQDRKAYACDVHSNKQKMFLLVEFPYPSAAGLHVGHPRSYTAIDLIARKRRMEGFEVMYGMGWDAFGLPAENYAIKTGTPPRISTNNNIAAFKRQLQSLGFSFDWDREIDTTDPKYYKWTQWMFLQIYKQGLAYKAPTYINFCPSCKTALANEEVIEGKCERCGNIVERRMKEQWLLRITQYADRLNDELDSVNYITPVVEQQRHWIGRSQGAEIDFKVSQSNRTLRVYSTRPDTLFGATFMVIAPEHPLVAESLDKISNADEVKKYVALGTIKSDMERTELAKTKTGVPLQGITVINPATGKEIPVWVADYVLISYGTGAVMAVPGHDERDWEFAKKFNLPIVQVISGGDVNEAAFTSTKTGEMVNSGFLNGKTPDDAKATMIDWLEKNQHGEAKTNFKLRDWVFSRQRYWGEPIPMVNCTTHGWVPLPESQLPLVLPELDDFQPTDDGAAPLTRATEWIKTTCPTCGGPATRETDTMPQWAGSCWYYMRYLDPNNDKAFCDPEVLKKWMPVDWYNGGMEHTTLHLLYSRFWHKALADGGYIPGIEPYARRTSHGMILGHDNEKMSKSRGNVVNPDSVVEKYGADTFRAYEMFMGDFDKTAPWNDNGVIGISRFLRKVWSLYERADETLQPTPEQMKALHQCFHDVDERMERMKFNTAVSSLMEFCNEIGGEGPVPASLVRAVMPPLSLFAPHVAEEIWQALGGEGLVVHQPWPKADTSLLTKTQMTIVVQINGKVRHTFDVAAGTTEGDVIAQAKAESSVAKWLDGTILKKHIYVPGKLINFIVAAGA